MSINKKIKMLREKAGMTQQDAAIVFGTSLSTYQKYERDKNPNQPSTEMLMQLARYYKVSLDWLLDMPNAAYKNPLDEFAQREHLKKLEKIFMKKYLSLTSDQRDEVLVFLRELAADVVSAEEARNQMEAVRVAAYQNPAGSVPREAEYPQELLGVFVHIVQQTDLDL